MFFEDMFGGGGFPGGFPGGGFGGRPQRPRGDTTALYNTLGVDQKATQAEIKKAFRKLAMKHHPDRGGDENKFKEINNAYEVLSDEAKRKAYDATGDPNADPNMLPGGRRKRKGKSTQFELEVPLSQFYTGHTRRIRVTKTIVCRGCEGKGGHGVTSCSTCRGRGVRIIDRELGRNMIQRMQMECDRCSGRGEVIPQGSKCTECRGGGLKKETKVLNVEITRGMKHNEKLTFHEEGDQTPETTPGDVVVVLKQAAHPTFTRTPDGCHLYINQEITLLESLTGFQLSFEHLDGRIMLVNSEPGKIYQKGDVKCIREEGFPLPQGATNGHLYINISVAMPTTLDQKTVTALKALLGSVPGQLRTRPQVVAAKATLQSQGTMTDDDVKGVVQEFTLETVDIEQEKRAYKEMLRTHHNQYDDDDDEQEMGGGQNVACRTQ
jgi:DnaJ family protein A protein 2